MFSGTIAEREIVAGGINCPVAEARWAESQSNRGAWTDMLLSRKSCVLTNDYSFWQFVFKDSLLTKLLEDFTESSSFLVFSNNSFFYLFFSHFILVISSLVDV